ncbi:YcdB/YcdC domain-containing protein [Brevibacillus brevis]|uniref:S-layer homology domain-containing protein n=1 Tax=Brevibacillus brevis TaxID=1393 RepID=A0ABY9T0E7_BREBE|nr:YcdB/YcdC domain-containing protein [Brevibacillus brevis]WNC13590.1 S-layer homology domain-containing protein [Brevibacillus brevis]
MRKETPAWKMAAGMSLALVLTPTLGIPLPAAPPVAYAAESASPHVTKEQAIGLAQKWIAIPQDYKQEDAMFLDAERERFFGQSSWQITWQDKKDESGIYVRIDAATGELLQYSRYDSSAKATSPSASISQEKALEVATDFLQRVTSADERKELAKPNQYGPLRFYSTDISEHAFTFTRVENGLPFLENGFQVVVDRSGEVSSFTREWTKGELPEPTSVLPVEQAEKLLAEKAGPSLLYKELSSMTGAYDQDSGKYKLVYEYSPRDPQFVDAVSGAVVNALGQLAESKGVQPLGTTVSPQDDSRTRVTKEQAQQIAEQLIKKLPGEYRSEGSRGGGGRSGPGGIEVRNWKFDFTPLHTKGKPGDTVQVRIDDRGQLDEFSTSERARFREDGAKIEKAVSWKEAEASAAALVKNLLSDRLGEIYLLDQQPSDEDLQNQLERGRAYEIRFGWIKDGVPIEDAEFFVQVNPQSGEAELLEVRPEDRTYLAGDKRKAIDASAAKKAERQQKSVMLTYYTPQQRHVQMPAANQKVMLVYRYVGDQGVVDGLTGEWISFKQEQKKQRPGDIADHPQQEALEFAQRMGLLTAEGGSLEPDKQVTRGELAQMLARMTNRIEFHSSHVSSSDDEGENPFPFADVDDKHPQFAAIYKAVQYGLIPKEGSRFEPDKAVTRAQAADMFARLLGYGDLLDKPGIFVSPYSDVAKKDTPAVTILHSLGLLPGEQSQSFHPNDPVTRAEAAQLMKAVLEHRQSKK